MFFKIGEEKWKKEKVYIPMCLSKFFLGWAALGNGLKTPLHHPPGEGLSSGKASRWWGGGGRGLAPSAQSSLSWKRLEYSGKGWGRAAAAPTLLCSSPSPPSSLRASGRDSPVPTPASLLLLEHTALSPPWTQSTGLRIEPDLRQKVFIVLKYVPSLQKQYIVKQNTWCIGKQTRKYKSAVLTGQGESFVPPREYPVS